MQNNTEKQIKEIMSEILEVEEDSITDEFSPEHTEVWDSLNNLKMVTALEENFKISLTMEEINSMVDFARIKNVICKYVK
ncbi:MAG: acyl carrier protein [Calothrix sp. MO_167.B12]|nr:acyl carrier protein [Calothrix sp. MO_167.B12]